MEHLCLDFINSDWRDWRGSGKRENRLENEEWVTAFLNNWGFKASFPPENNTLSILIEIRELMRKIIEDNVSGQGIHNVDIEKVNALLRKAPYYLQIGQSNRLFVSEQRSLSEGWQEVIDSVLHSFVFLLTKCDIGRIKICDNDDCRWVFYDESRNKVRRWCDDRACGNLMKVRRFRNRQKEETE